jgi:ABC-type uncharacterized transport system ATPase component
VSNVNEFAEEARARKAARLVAAARHRGYNAQTIAENVAARDDIVRRTGVRQPSLATWKMVVAQLDAIANVPADPWEGL